MPHSTIVSDDGVVFVASFLPERRRGDMYQSIVLAQLIDELTARPVRDAVELTCDLAHARLITGADGIAGVAGVPSQLFPRLASQPYPIDVEFRATGYVPRRPPVSVPQQLTFPDTFAGVDLVPLQVHRGPVYVTVRTMTTDGTVSSGADVSVAGLWRTLADLASSSAPAAPDIVALQPALARDRSTTATLAPVTLNAVAEPTRLLAADAAVGATRVAVTRTGALAAGLLLGIDRGDPDRVEHIHIKSVQAPIDLQSPATVELEYPLQRTHAQFAPAQIVNVVPLGPTAGLVADAAAGDVTVFVTSTAPFSATPTVQVSDGVAIDEFVSAARYEATTDADGYCTLPPLHRVAAVEVAAANGPLTAPATKFSLTYEVRDNQLHLTLE